MKRYISTYCQTTSNATRSDTFARFTSTGNDPRQGWRTPLNNIIYSEQRDEEKETSSECFASEPKVTNTFESKQLSEYRGEEPRSGTPFDSNISTTHHGARCYDAGLLTEWLSVDLLADNYPDISPYA